MRSPILFATLALHLLSACDRPGEGFAPLPTGEVARTGESPPAPAAAIDPALVPALRPVADGIWCGGEPHGEEAYAALRALGVRTVVSVDGSRPAVEAAAAAGLRTIHLPIGYDGIPAPTRAALARLVAETEGPIFVHCHHGKHRGPAAAAVVALGAGKIDGEEARALLEMAGTSRGYDGLWRAVETFAPPAPGAPATPLLPVAEVGGLAGAMAMLDRAKDRLALLEPHGFGANPEHPDLVAAKEAEILRQGFSESIRALLEDAKSPTPEHPDPTGALRAGLEAAERLARELEGAKDPAELETRFAAVGATCKPCHVDHRD